jgi:hypothetical protein
MPVPIEIETDGRRVTGTYVVEAGMITVSSASGSKTTHVGNTPTEVLARLLLSELA